MVTKRNRTGEPNKSEAASPAPDARAGKPERRPAPRKRTDVPAKVARPGKIERPDKLERPAKAEPSAVEGSAAAASVVSKKVPTEAVPCAAAGEAGADGKVEEPRAMPSGAGALKKPKRPKRAARSAASAAPDGEAPAAADASAQQQTESGDSAGDQDESAAQPRKRAGEAKASRKKWPFVAAAVVLLLVVAVAGFLSWDRWLRYDDAAELQGEWQVHGSTGVVVINADSIKLTEDVTWGYTMDPGSKTLSYTFGNNEGHGRYRFSLDRNQLVIMDGTGYSWLSTLMDDVGWMADQAVHSLQGAGAQEAPSGDNVIVLDRLSHDGNASPRAGTAVEAEASDEGAQEEAGAAPAEGEQAAEEGAQLDEGASEQGSSDAGATDQPASPDAGTAPDAEASGNDGSSASPVNPGAAFDVSDRAA